MTSPEEGWVSPLFMLGKVPLSDNEGRLANGCGRRC